MNLTNYEKETIIRYNQDEAEANIYTMDPVLIRKLGRIAAADPLAYVLREDEDSKTYIVPKKWVKVVAPPKLTDTEREKRAAATRAREVFGHEEGPSQYPS